MSPGYHASLHERVSVHWHLGRLASTETSIPGHAPSRGVFADPIRVAWARGVIAELAATGGRLLAQVCAGRQPSIGEDDLLGILSEHVTQRRCMSE